MLEKGCPRCSCQARWCWVGWIDSGLARFELTKGPGWLERRTRGDTTLWQAKLWSNEPRKRGPDPLCGSSAVLRSARGHHTYSLLAMRSLTLLWLASPSLSLCLAGSASSNGDDEGPRGEQGWLRGLIPPCALMRPTDDGLHTDERSRTAKISPRSGWGPSALFH